MSTAALGATESSASAAAREYLQKLFPLPQPTIKSGGLQKVTHINESIVNCIPKCIGWCRGLAAVSWHNGMW